MTSALTIRPATAADVPSLAMLIQLGKASDPPSREAAWQEAQHPHYLEAFARIAADKNQFLLVGERAGQVVATCQLTLIPGLSERGRLRAKLESVHTDPDWRGQGIGRQMVAHALELCRANGVGLLELTSNKSRLDAHRFYRTLGFSQTHEGFKMAIDFASR